MDDSDSSKPKGRWCRFSLRTLLLFVLVVGTGFGWLGNKVHRIRNERDAVAEIQRVGGTVTFGGFCRTFFLAEDDHASSGPWGRPRFIVSRTRVKPIAGMDRWLRRWLGVGSPVSAVEWQNTGVTDADLAALDYLPNLELLMLHNTEITDEGLLHLAGLNNLQLLTLSGTQITDAGLVHLKELGKLRRLGLGGTKVTRQALDKLQADLPLTGIRLSLTARIEIGRRGMIQVDESSRYEPVVAVSLPRYFGSKFTDADLMHLKRLTTLESLDCPSTQITDAGLEHLKGLANLQVLNLEATRITGAGLVHLHGLTGLRELRLGGDFRDHSGRESLTLITDAGLVYLNGFTTLERLHINARCTDAGLVHLRGLPNLHELYLRGTLMTDVEPENLQGLTNLECLGLIGSTVNVGHLKGLAKLRKLDLTRNQARDLALEHLKVLKNLEILSLRQCRITDADLVHLEGLTDLKGLNLVFNNEITDAGLKHLEGLTSLETLDLGLTKVTDQGIERLHQTLPKCKIEPRSPR